MPGEAGTFLSGFRAGMRRGKRSLAVAGLFRGRRRSKPYRYAKSRCRAAHIFEPFLYHPKIIATGGTRLLFCQATRDIWGLLGGHVHIFPGRLGFATYVAPSLYGHRETEKSKKISLPFVWKFPIETRSNP